MTQLSVRAYALVVSAAALFAVAPCVSAGTIPFDTWLEFAVSDAGVPATGCDPDDPTGGFCTPSSGTPTLFLDAPPWTFVAPASGASLVVTDAFESTERFELFDFGASLGLTSAPAATAVVECGDDPVVCLASGAHSITLTPTMSQGGGGYLLVTAAVVVPEPGVLALLAIGLAAIALQRRTR